MITTERQSFVTRPYRQSNVPDLNFGFFKLMDGKDANIKAGALIWVTRSRRLIGREWWQGGRRVQDNLHNEKEEGKGLLLCVGKHSDGCESLVCQICRFLDQVDANVNGLRCIYVRFI